MVNRQSLIRNTSRKRSGRPDGQLPIARAGGFGTTSTNTTKGSKKHVFPQLFVTFVFLARKPASPRTAIPRTG
jgi:hypothetical protein